MFFRYFQIFAIGLLTTMYSCRHINPSYSVKQKINFIDNDTNTDFKMNVNVEDDNIRITLINISSQDMLLEISYDKLNYLMKYKTVIDIKEISDMILFEGAYTPFSVFHVLGFKMKDTNWVTRYMYYSFLIKKPNDFINLESIQIDFRAIPLSAISNVKKGDDLARQLNHYQLVYSIPKNEQ